MDCRDDDRIESKIKPNSAMRGLKVMIEQEVMKKDGKVYQCVKCSNLSLDKRNWLIVVDLPKHVHPNFNYITSICTYCKDDVSHTLKYGGVIRENGKP